MSDEIVTQLKYIIKKAILLQSKLNLGTSMLTPTNLLEEREKFFASADNNPVFVYKKKKLMVTEDDIELLLTDLNNLEIDQDLKDYFFNAIYKFKLVKKTIEAIGTDNFASFSSQLFNISQIEIDTHLNMIPELKFNEPSKKELWSALTIKNHFEQIIMERYGLDEVKILLDEFNPFTIRVSNQKVIVGGKIKRYSHNVERLTVHEIESHVLRRQSLLQTKNVLHRLASYDQSILYSEGLAVYNEITTGKITESAMNIYINRMQSVNRIHLSFREIYNYLINFLEPKIAFIMTYRVKRGMRDTSQPGGFKKDAYYLMGYFRVKEFVDKGGDIKDLYRFALPELITLLRKHNLASTKYTILPRFLSS